MITPLRYALLLDPHPEDPVFYGEVSIDVSVEREGSRIVLHAEGLQIDSVKIDGRPVAFETAADRLLLLPGSLASSRATIAITYHGHFDESGRGLLRSGDCIVTQLQPSYARRVFPCFDDPRWKTPFDVTVVAAPGQKVVANAPLLAEETCGDRRRLQFATSPPMPPHLLGLAIGPFEVTTADAGATPVRFLSRAAAGRDSFAIDAAIRFLHIHSSILGIAYPWPKLDLVAIPEYEAAAIETTSVICFREAAVLVDDAASPEQRREVSSLVAHELAHQWFGSLVTPASWEELWLSEGFATWLAARAMSLTDGSVAGVARTRAMRAAMAADSLPSSRPLHRAAASAEQAHELYDVIPYEKGAALLGMIERWLGAEKFARGVSLYLRRHAGAHATSRELWRALEDVSGESVAAVAAHFVTRTGVPAIEVEWSGSTIRIAQTDAEVAAIPVAVRIGLDDGSVARRSIVLTTYAELRMERDVAWVFGNDDARGYYRVRHADASTIATEELNDAEATALLADAWDALWEGSGDTIDYLRVLQSVGNREALAAIAGAHLTDLGDLFGAGGRLDLFNDWRTSRFHRLEIRRRAFVSSISEAFASARSGEETLLCCEELLSNPETREAAWEHLKSNWEALHRQVISFGGRGAIAALASAADRATRNDIATFFSSRPLPGAERTLKQTLETIDSRIALREREQHAFDAWLTRQSRPDVIADETLRAAHTYLNALRAGFEGAVVHRAWIDALGVVPPEWMHTRADLVRVTATLERRLLAIYGGTVVIDASLYDLSARLQEDLLASAEWVSAIRQEGPEGAADGTVRMLMASIARQAAVYESQLRGAITFCELLELAAAARELRKRLRSTDAKRRRIRILLARCVADAGLADIRSELWQAAATIADVQRSQAAEIVALTAWWNERPTAAARP